MSELIQKPSVDLVEGDIVYLGTMIDVVKKVTIDVAPSVLVRVDALRTNYNTDVHWYAGKKTLQTVEKK